jgi:hypothetical protein
MRDDPPFSDFFGIGCQLAPGQLREVRRALSISETQPRRALEILKHVKAVSPTAWGAWVDAYSGFLWQRAFDAGARQRGLIA